MEKTITTSVWSGVFAFAVISVFVEARAENPNLAKQPILFNRDIRPVLSNNCFQCHGPDAANRQAELRLDIDGAIDWAEVIARVTSSDPDEHMPPRDSNKELSQEQISLLQGWIENGAEYQGHWAFLPPQSSSAHASQASGEQTIDNLVLRRLEREGLALNAPAEKRTLIRRLTFDLTGLPPSMQEVHDFLEDDKDGALERLVDRLLDSPQYGEHMARYWLDLVRFADTNGLHHDHYREMTPYRDWVIRSFNNGLPFDEFIVAQIAGDLYEQPTTDQQVASGFNRLHLIIDRGTALPEESFMRNVVDRVSAVGTAFMGLTLECAVCHDHKYDPITQRDFYQLYAFFNNFDGEPETGGRNGTDFQRGLQPPYLELPTPEQSAEREQYATELASLTRDIARLEKKLADELNSKREEDSDDVKAARDAAVKAIDEEVEQQKKKLKQVEKSRDALVALIPAALVMKERQDIRPAHIMIRGNYDQPGESVERNTPSFLPPLETDAQLKTRMDLAKWLVAPSNPLTARVAVNRFWQQLFGTGLVRTSEDFGAQGETPSHPELLDYLTVRFVDSGWNVKSLLRFIVLSKTYQQSSVATRERFTVDPSNRLLSRGSRYRLDAEVIRDQVLAVTGLLNKSLYGKSVKPPQPAGLWETIAMPSSYPRIYEPDAGDKIYRRSVYTFWKRAMPLPQLTIFDAPSRESCIARRERTNTPLQALVLMNEQQYFSATISFANSLLCDTSLSNSQRIAVAYETITSHVPTDAQMTALEDALAQFQDLYAGDPESANQLIAQRTAEKSSEPSEPLEPAELAAFSMLVHSVLNLDIARNRE
jgi:hypothetical protein